MSTKLITADFTDALELAEDLQFLDAQTLFEMRRNSAKVTASAVRVKAIAQVRRELNLSETYITSRIEQEEGGASSFYWTEVVRSPFDGTTLQRFGGGLIQLFKPVTWDNNYIRANHARSIGAWVDGKWTLRTGDTSRGIPTNFKQNGVMAQVKRGAPKRIATAFTMPLRRGNDRTAGGNGVGAFRRNKATGQLEHLYGPSVYQVFRRYINENEQAIADTLRDEFIVRLDLATQKLTTP